MPNRERPRRKTPPGGIRAPDDIIDEIRTWLSPTRASREREAMMRDRIERQIQKAMEGPGWRAMASTGPWISKHPDPKSFSDTIHRHFVQGIDPSDELPRSVRDALAPPLYHNCRAVPVSFSNHEQGEIVAKFYDAMRSEPRIALDDWQRATLRRIYADPDPGPPSPRDRIVAVTDGTKDGPVSFFRVVNPEAEVRVKTFEDFKRTYVGRKLHDLAAQAGFYNHAVQSAVQTIQGGNMSDKTPTGPFYGLSLSSADPARNTKTFKRRFDLDVVDHKGRLQQLVAYGEDQFNELVSELHDLMGKKVTDAENKLADLRNSGEKWTERAEFYSRQQYALAELAQNGRNMLKRDERSDYPVEPEKVPTGLPTIVLFSKFFGVRNGRKYDYAAIRPDTMDTWSVTGKANLRNVSWEALMDFVVEKEPGDYRIRAIGSVRALAYTAPALVPLYSFGTTGRRSTEEDPSADAFPSERASVRRAYGSDPFTTERGY